MLLYIKSLYINTNKLLIVYINKILHFACVLRIIYIYSYYMNGAKLNFLNVMLKNKKDRQQCDEEKFI